MMALSRTLSGQMLESGFAEHPDHTIRIEPAKRIVTVTVGGSVLMKTAHALVLYEADYAPVYYFPRDEVNMALLTPTVHSTWCPYKGAASYFSIISENDDVLENAVWSYGDPFEEIAAIKDYLGFMPPHATITVSEV